MSKKSNYNSTNRSKIQIYCKRCGNHFTQRVLSHYHHGCPKCNRSKGENLIAKYLIEHNINFISEKRFEDCRDKNTLSFDFYLPEYQTVIEYDGEQHYKIKEYFGGIKSFEKLKIHDNIKNNYCITNDINMLRITYKDDIIKKLEGIKNKTEEFIKY